AAGVHDVHPRRRRGRDLDDGVAVDDDDAVRDDALRRDHRAAQGILRGVRRNGEQKKDEDSVAHVAYFALPCDRATKSSSSRRNWWPAAPRWRAWTAFRSSPRTSFPATSRACGCSK